MRHRKLCGCLTEVTYKNTIKGLKTIIKRLKICKKHKKDKEK